MYERYAALRDAKGVTDYRVAADIGISRTTLHDWGKGTYEPKLDKLRKIAKYFGVSIEELIGD